MPRSRRNRPRDAARRRRRLTQIVGAVVVTMLIGGSGAAAFLADGDNGGGGAEEVDEAGATNDAARELLRLLDNQKTLTYHARYEPIDGNQGATAFEIWQTPSKMRQDTVLVTKEGAVSSRTIITADQRVQCAARNEGAWTCHPATAQDVAAADPVGVLRQQLEGATVTVRDERARGQPARCFSIARGAEQLELCVLAERGVPTSIRGGAAHLQLAVLDDDVAEQVFVPPAEVS